MVNKGLSHELAGTVWVGPKKIGEAQIGLFFIWAKNSSLGRVKMGGIESSQRSSACFTMFN